MASAGVGAIAGGLIGSGFGATAGGSMMGAVLSGAGVGAASNGLFYEATHQNNFNTSVFVEDAAIGALTGAFTSGVGSAPVSPGAKVIASGIYNTIGGEATYLFQQTAEGKPISYEGLALTGLTSFGAGVMGGGIAAKAYLNDMVTYGPPVVTQFNPVNVSQQLIVINDSLLVPNLSSATVSSVVRDTGIWVSTSYLETKLEEILPW
jgi:hypothetical protein